MRRTTLRLRLALLFACALGAARAELPQPPALEAQAWLLADAASGQVLAAQGAEARIEPASLTKVMTAYVIFGALREGRITLAQRVRVSERASRAPGSRMFLEADKPVTVEELIRGLVVHSGNDAGLALAEAIAQSEESFVALMNREAARLGLAGTRFANATGLPDPAHYSSAADLYRLTAALIRDFPQRYAEYYALKEYSHNGITQPNRNRLLWLDPNVDGVKTGHTETAGYCLIASARRGERRLVSVLLGARSDAARARESQKLLNWGFQSFDGVKLYAAGEAVKEIEVWKGAANRVRSGFRGGLVIAVPKGMAGQLEARLRWEPTLVAPVADGQRVGVLDVLLEGRPWGEFALVALDPVAQAGPLGRAWDTLRLWLK